MINSKSINDLHPILQEKYKELERLSSKKKIFIKLTSSYRDFEYQNFLFTQVPTVTNAKGGYSYHNFWLAFDFCINDKQHAYNIHLLTQVGVLGESLGLEWGGNFKFVDRPHFQLTFGKELKQLRKMTKDEIFNLR